MYMYMRLFGFVCESVLRTLRVSLSAFVCVASFHEPQKWFVNNMLWRDERVENAMRWIVCVGGLRLTYTKTTRLHTDAPRDIESNAHM